MRHQRVVILTHPKTVKSFIERRDKPLRDVEEVANRKKVKLAKKEQARLEMEQKKRAKGKEEVGKVIARRRFLKRTDSAVSWKCFFFFFS